MGGWGGGKVAEGFGGLGGGALAQPRAHPHVYWCRGIELNAKVRGCMNPFFHAKKVGAPISYKLGALITYQRMGQRTDFIQSAGVNKHRSEGAISYTKQGLMTHVIQQYMKGRSSGRSPLLPPSPLGPNKVWSDIASSVWEFCLVWRRLNMGREW